MDLGFQPVPELGQPALTRSGSWDLLDWPIWDSVSIATAGTTVLNFFTVPIGGTKTALDTNLKAAGQIPNGSLYDVNAIGFGLRNSAATPIVSDEFREIIYTGWLEFLIENQTWFEAPLSKLPFGGGDWGAFGSMTVAAGNVSQTNGLPAYDAMYKLNRAIRIAKNVSFAARINWPTAPTPAVAIFGVVVLHGIAWRAGK